MTAEIASAGSRFGRKPDGRDAAAHAGSIRALLRSERRRVARAMHHGRQALVQIVDREEIFAQLLLFLGENHGDAQSVRKGAKIHLKLAVIMLTRKHQPWQTMF